METKNKNKNKNKKGISLIVLIITIIVVIILAAIIIITLTKNNPVSSAKEATFKQDVRNFQDELSMYIGNENIKDIQGNREKITTVDMPSVEVMKEYIESFSSKYENKLGIYKDELVYYKPDNEVKNKVTDKEEKWLQDLGINKKVVETTEESFEWGSDDPNNSEYYTLKKFIGKETDVIIPKRCHKIGNEAFKNSKVTSVKMQDGITYIGKSAFGDCTALKEIKLPNTLIDIGSNTFSNCQELESIELPDSLEYLDTWSFYGCEKLKIVKIPDKIKYIPQGTFASCDSLEKVILPDSCGSIHPSAFNGCKNLKEINIENIGYIADSAFAYTGLVNVNISKSTFNLGYGVFAFCDKLQNINVASENTSFCSVDGVLYSKDKKILMEYPRGRTSEGYEVLGSTTSIQNQAFYGCNTINTIKLPDGLKSIGRYAFSLCKNLSSINIPSAVEKIDAGTFSGSNNLTSVYIPLSVVTIGEYVTNGCGKLNIECERNEDEIPSTWNKYWNSSNRPVTYGVKK